MNYRDFYRKEEALAGKKRLTENIDFSKIPPQLMKGVEVELEHTPSRGKKLEDADEKDIRFALRTATDHYKEDKNYYQKLASAGLEERSHVPEIYGGLETVNTGPILDVPSRLQPVAVSRIVSPAACFGSRTTGNEMGSVPGDKEKITAAGQTEDSMTSKSVGGSIVPNKGQSQGGPNTQGNIAGTPREVPGSKTTGQKGANTISSTAGTPVNTSISPSFNKGIGTTTNQSFLGQFADGEEEEEGEDVTISLNESVKKMVREMVIGVIDEVKSKKSSASKKQPKKDGKTSKKKKWIQKVVDTKHKDTPTSKKALTPKRKTLAKRFKKGDLQKEAKFISRKINEGRDLNDYEKDLIKEIVLSNALSMREKLDTGHWSDQEEGEKTMLDSYIETAVRYRSRDESEEDVVNQVVRNAEDRLGIHYIDDDEVRQKVSDLWNEYPARY